MPQAPPACRHESPGRRNTKDGATPRMGRLAPKTGQRNIRAGAAQPQKRNLAMSGLVRCNPKNEIARHQNWSGATPKTEPRNVWAGAVQPKKRNRATSELERRNPKNGTSQCQGWSGATQKNEIARHQSWSGATSGTKQRNPIDRTAQPSRSSVSFEAGNQRPGRRFGHTHGAICREKAQAARACKGSCGRNLTAH